MFQLVPLNIAGPSYLDRSRPLSSQRTVNFYHELNPSGKDKYVIKSFPGQKAFGSVGGGIERGSHVCNGILFRIKDNRLYEVSSDGTHTDRGVIIGDDRCTFADDGENLFIVVPSVKVYQYNIYSNALTEVTDTDITGAKSVTVLNNQFIYTFDRLSVLSDVGDGSSATSLNAVGAESQPDGIVRDYAFDQVVYRFGTKTVELWYNSGVGTPPFDRITGQLFNVGLLASHSVRNTREYVYWLGSDHQIYRARGGQEEPISTPAITGIIEGLNTVADAYGDVIAIDNKYFYVLTFPSESRTFAVNEELGANGWFELSEGIGDNRFNAGSIVQAYNKTYVCDFQDGHIRELDFSTYTIGGDTWQRRRVISSINGDLLGQKGQRVQMSRLELIIETGTGLISGQGEDPRIMIEPSYDGGRTWATGTWMKVGRLGQFDIRAEWYSLKSFYDMIVRITVSDPVNFSIYSGSVELRLAGR